MLHDGHILAIGTNFYVPVENVAIKVLLSERGHTEYNHESKSHLSMTELRFYDFFAGAGLAGLGLGDGWTCVWANDIDPKKADVYKINFPEDHFFLGDIANFKATDLPNSTQLAWASFPCQDLSLAGWRRGLSADRSGAFWPFWRIMRDQFRSGCRPPLMVIENVAGLLYGESFTGLCEALAALGMQFGALVIDAQYFLPQSRPRVFVVAADSRLDCSAYIAHEAVKEWTPVGLRVAYKNLPDNLKELWRWWNLPTPTLKRPPLAKLIQKNPTDVTWHTKEETSYLLSLMSEKNRKKVRDAQRIGGGHIGFIYKRMRNGIQRAEVRFDGISGCLRTPKGGSSRQIVIIVEDGVVRSRLLSSREAARLMGVPDTFKLPAAYNQAYKAMGDAVAVPVVSWLSKHLLQPLVTLAGTLQTTNNHHPQIGFLIERSEKRASEWTVEIKRKAMKQLQEKTMNAVREWFDYEQRHLDGDSDRYVVCAGLAIAHALKTTFPLRHEDFITDRNQVKTGGPLIRNILREFGEDRIYASEGGRTTRGTRPAAERLAATLNKVTDLSGLSKADRAAIAKAIQEWLFENGVKPYFNKKRIEVDIHLDKPGSKIIAEILETAAKRNAAGGVAHHLVGAKLALRYPNRTIENYSYTTADQQLGRHGDYAVGDTAFHVTVAPMQAVVDKCVANVRHGFRPILLVTEHKMEAARQMAEMSGHSDRIGINSLEQFVGQNIEEIGEFGKEALRKNVKALLEKYNERVADKETDRSLLIEIPENL
jgi:DNA (cytosine-5)-methyltransferase 1